MRRSILALAALAAALAATSAATAGTRISVGPVVDVSRDQLSQNETPIAINPVNPANMITGANDWNYNDGCAVNATFDGGKTWTRFVCCQVKPPSVERFSRSAMS